MEKSDAVRHYRKVATTFKQNIVYLIAKSYTPSVTAPKNIVFNNKYIFCCNAQKINPQKINPQKKQIDQQI
jgi:hypothetical protein